MDEARRAVLRGDRRAIPGAVRASCGLGTTGEDVDALLEALALLADGAPAPVPYEQDSVTGDYWPVGEARGPGRFGAPGRSRVRTRVRRPAARATRLVVGGVLCTGVPLLAACSSTPAGSAGTRTVAWVATDASVTLPGTTVTALDTITRGSARGSAWAASPRRWPTPRTTPGCSW